MTNDVYTFGLTRTELQTLRVLLPITFPIIQCDANGVQRQDLKNIMDTARCIVINPKHIDPDTFEYCMVVQQYKIDFQQPVPMILLSAPLTREQHRMVRIPQYMPIINLYKRLDQARSVAMNLLRTASFPCWQNRKNMEHYMFNDSWYLIDIETTGADIWKDNITCIRIAYMADYKIEGTPKTIYIKQQEPQSDDCSEQTGNTAEKLTQGIPLQEAVELIEYLECSDTPLIFTSEEYTAGFLHTAFLRCGKRLERPYLAIDKLAAIPFGYLMQRRALDIPLYVEEKQHQSSKVFDDTIRELYELTVCVFEALFSRYDVRCPGEFDKLYAGEICE